MQSPGGQAWIGSGFAIAGLLAVPAVTEWRGHESKKVFPMWGALAIFTALVWMDSAAFFIIQHSEDLKSGTWGEGLLWRNAAVHLAVALRRRADGSRRGGARLLPALAWVILAAAALAVNARVLARPCRLALSGGCVALFGGSGGMARLVFGSRRTSATPAGGRRGCLRSPVGSARRTASAWRKRLQRVPPEFVAGAGCVGGRGDGSIRSEALAVRRGRGGGVLVAMAFPQSETILHRRCCRARAQVYLSEGCIHCHSQYVRPGSLDEQNWGPVRDVEGGAGGATGADRQPPPGAGSIQCRRAPLGDVVEAAFHRSTGVRARQPDAVLCASFRHGKGRRSRALSEGITGVSGMGKVMETASQWKPGRHGVG